MSNSKSRAPRAYIGVDLGGTHVRAGRVDQDRIVALKSYSIRASGDKQEVFDDLCLAIDAVMDKSVRGIGIGAPSLVDRASGILQDTVNIPSWTSVPIKRWLEKKYGVPVALDNDANCFALGERRYGAGREVDNFVGLSLGTGLGCGIISNGQLHSGVLSAAGEFGMIPYRDSILEHYASGRFFKDLGLDGELLARQAVDGNLDAQRHFNDYAVHLAYAIKLILFTLAPELIVLGGSVSRSLPFFRTALDASLDDFPYDGVRKKLKLKLSKLKNGAVLGAASLVIEA